jgi:3-oxoacyl-[acyl-carrier-protein] synthase-3
MSDLYLDCLARLRMKTEYPLAVLDASVSRSAPARVLGLAYVLGEARSTDVLYDFLSEEDAAVLRDLQRDGIASFRSTDQPVHVLAAESVRKTLERAGRNIDEIDAIIYASEAYKTGNLRSDLRKFCSFLGLTSTPVFCATGGTCGNVGLAIGQALSLLAAGSAREVLVVSSDTAPSCDKRLANPKVTVRSDGAASCIVSNRTPSPLSIVGCRMVFDHSWRYYNETTPQSFVQSRLRMFRESIRGVDPSSFVTSDKLPAFFMSNLGIRSMSLIAKMIGVTGDDVYTANVSRIGHAFSADALINLSDALSEHVAPATNRRIALLSNTEGLCSFISLELEAARVEGRSPCVDAHAEDCLAIRANGCPGYVNSPGLTSSNDSSAP